MKRALVTGALLSLIACTSSNETELLLPLRVGGSVVSSTTDAPVAGASVTLGRGGDFSLPADLKTVQAGANGSFMITHTVSHPRNSCPFMWVRVDAPGYVTSSIENVRHTVRCTGSLQTINVRLTPAIQ